jgi:hypothetical protein
LICANAIPKIQKAELQERINLAMDHTPMGQAQAARSEAVNRAAKERQSEFQQAARSRRPHFQQCSVRVTFAEANGRCLFPPFLVLRRSHSETRRQHVALIGGEFIRGLNDNPALRNRTVDRVLWVTASVSESSR